MHTDFAEWYRAIGMEPDGEKLPKRWAAVEEFSPGRAEVVALARLFYKAGPPDEKVLASFRAALQKGDPTIPIKGNDQEIAMLAGAELIDVIERSKPSLADLAALALLCTSAQNLRPSTLVPDIPELASTYIADRSTNRTSTTSEEEKTDPKSPDGILFESFKQQGEPWDKAVTFFERLVKKESSISAQLQVTTEEANILWWLFGEHSRGLNQRWDKIQFAGVPLIAGKELADLVVVLPGPIAANAFLDRVIRCAKSKPPTEITISDAVNAAPLAWREKFIRENRVAELDDITPVMRAIGLSLQSSDNNAWTPAFAQATGIQIDAKLPPNMLAYQMYLEGLLCRAWKMLK